MSEPRRPPRVGDLGGSRAEARQDETVIIQLDELGLPPAAPSRAPAARAAPPPGPARRADYSSYPPAPAPAAKAPRGQLPRVPGLVVLALVIVAAVCLAAFLALVVVQ